MEIKYPSYHPEIWGGLECTINRIGDAFRDQLKYAGFYERSNDIEKIAELGIKALRFPVLWEAHQSTSENESIDWTKAARGLQKLRSFQITPIVGLLHHGSGPAFTSLLDDHFPKKLANYATKVAAQFPWIEYYTPVNEPLTTARFSGLYGCWYPHHKDEKSFVKMLLNQLKGTVLAMKAIRKINPAAKLIQTEDLTKTHSSPLLSYQAEFENKRRWLSYDILSGTLNDQRFFWYYFIGGLGVKQQELDFFIENPCPPDIAGFNYYVTSERFLDENMTIYPFTACGGNGRHEYADVAAVRAVKPAGLKSLLTEAWKRFHIPLALTEVHLNCSREEQLRWLKEAWDQCVELNQEGIKVKAITAWSLLGAFDWNSLLTREEGIYESGVFDITGKKLRSTALAKLVRSFSQKENYDHPLIHQKGWWHKCYHGNETVSSSNCQPLMILGANGTLGSAFRRICDLRSIPYKAFSRQQLDITQTGKLEKCIEDCKPWAIVNTTGYVNVDTAEFEKEKCFQINTEAPAHLSLICNKKGIQLMTFSSDLVFDGEKQSPYIENDLVKPLNEYGRSKAIAEKKILQLFPGSLVIRTSAFFGPWDQYNFAFSVLNYLKKNKNCRIVKDVIVSPTYVPDLVNKSLDLLIDEEKGIWHLSNTGMVTWFDFAGEIAQRAGYCIKNIISCRQDEAEWKAKRPGYSALQSDKGIRLPSLTNAIGRFFEEKIS